MKKNKQKRTAIDKTMEELIVLAGTAIGIAVTTALTCMGVPLPV